MSRENNFNFLRLLLATLVIVSHSQSLPFGTSDMEWLVRFFHGPTLGDLAVDGFFVISGFLITQSYVRTGNPWKYFKKRVARIYPGFMVCALFVGLLLAPANLGWHAYFAAFPLPRFLLDVLLLHFRSPRVWIQPWNFPIDLNTPTWTIAVEFTGYLSVLVIGGLGLLKRIPLATFILLATIWWWVVPDFQAFTSPYYLDPIQTPRFFEFFFAGSLAWVCRDGWSYTGRGALLAAIALFILLPLKQPGLVLLPLPITYLMLWAAFSPAPFLNWFKAVPDISYGTYLYGWPIAAVLLYKYPHWSPWLYFALTLPLAYCCGFVSWHVVEKHGLRWANQGY